MSVVQQFGTSGEVLAPALRAAMHILEWENALLREQSRLLTTKVSGSFKS